MLTRIAALHVRHSVLRMRGSNVVVLMSSGPVVVLRMIVGRVGVGVQRRHQAGGRNQRRDERDSQDAVHRISL